MKREGKKSNETIRNEQIEERTGYNLRQRYNKEGDRRIKGREIQ